jgi:hypothetical protein
MTVSRLLPFSHSQSSIGGNCVCTLPQKQNPYFQVIVIFFYRGNHLVFHFYPWQSEISLEKFFSYNSFVLPCLSNHIIKFLFWSGNLSCNISLSVFPIPFSWVYSSKFSSFLKKLIDFALQSSFRFTAKMSRVQRGLILSPHHNRFCF